MNKTLDLTSIKIEKEHLKLLNEIINLDVYWEIENFENFEDEDDLVYTFYRLELLKSIKDKLIALEDRLHYDVLYQDIELNVDECVLLEGVVKHYVERYEEDSIDGQDVVNVGIWITGAPVFNVYKEDMPFLIQLLNTLNKITELNDLENAPGSGISVSEYFGLDEESEDDNTLRCVE